MINISTSNFAKKIYEIGDQDTISSIIKLSHIQNVDQTFTYVFIKAFNLHLAKIYLENNGKLDKFEDVYMHYKICLDEHYKDNNEGISKDLLSDVLEAFDKTFEFIGALDYDRNVINDSYELRHYLIESLEYLRMLLEKKSESKIRQDLFEGSITTLKNNIDELVLYIDSVNVVN